MLFKISIKHKLEVDGKTVGECLRPLTYARTNGRTIRKHNAYGLTSDGREALKVLNTDYYTWGCWWRSTVVERRSVTGELSLSCARPAADE